MIELILFGILLAMVVNTCDTLITYKLIRHCWRDDLARQKEREKRESMARSWREVMASVSDVAQRVKEAAVADQSFGNACDVREKLKQYRVAVANLCDSVESALRKKESENK